MDVQPFQRAYQSIDQLFPKEPFDQERINEVALYNWINKTGELKAIPLVSSPFASKYKRKIAPFFAFAQTFPADLEKGRDQTKCLLLLVIINEIAKKVFQIEGVKKKKNAAYEKDLREFRTKALEWMRRLPAPQKKSEFLFFAQGFLSDLLVVDKVYQIDPMDRPLLGYLSEIPCDMALGTEKTSREASKEQVLYLFHLYYLLNSFHSQRSHIFLLLKACMGKLTQEQAAEVLNEVPVEQMMVILEEYPKDASLQPWIAYALERASVGQWVRLLVVHPRFLTQEQIWSLFVSVVSSIQDTKRAESVRGNVSQLLRRFSDEFLANKMNDNLWKTVARYYSALGIEMKDEGMQRIALVNTSITDRIFWMLHGVDVQTKKVKSIDCEILPNITSALLFGVDLYDPEIEVRNARGVPLAGKIAFLYGGKQWMVTDQMVNRTELQVVDEKVPLDLTARIDAILGKVIPITLPNEQVSRLKKQATIEFLYFLRDRKLIRCDFNVDLLLYICTLHLINYFCTKKYRLTMAGLFKQDLRDFATILLEMHADVRNARDQSEVLDDMKRLHGNILLLNQLINEIHSKSNRPCTIYDVDQIVQSTQAFALIFKNLEEQAAKEEETGSTILLNSLQENGKLIKQQYGSILHLLPVNGENSQQALYSNLFRIYVENINQFITVLSFVQIKKTMKKKREE